MELPYSNFDHCLLFNTIKNNIDLKKAIAFLVSFNEYENLKAKALEHSILIFNEEIAIYLILYVGFEENEFVQNKMINSNYISFEKVTNSMQEFKDIDVKFLDKFAVLFTAISLGNNSTLEDFKIFLNL